MRRDNVAASEGQFAAVCRKPLPVRELAAAVRAVLDARRTPSATT